MRSRLVLLYLLLATWPAVAIAVDDALTGRWAFDFDVAAYEKGTPLAAVPNLTGVGTPPADASRPSRVVLDVVALSGGALVGTVNGIQGTRWSGAGSPQGPVEIADGRAADGRLSFRVWRFDQVSNFMRVEGRVVGDTLELTLSRDGTPPYSVTVKATRLSRRPASTLWD